MSWRQVKTPNFDPVIYQGEPLRNWVGYCMAYVEQSVGQMYVYGNAMEGWEKVKGRHANKSVPTGVWLPLWYRGWVYNGVEQGHVLWAKFNKDGSGVAYTSPNDPKSSADKIAFSSLDNLTHQLQQGWASDISYRGWSEWVGSQRIIIKEEDEEVLTNKNHLKSIFRRYMGREPQEGEYKRFIGGSYHEAIDKIDKSSETQRYQGQLRDAADELKAVEVQSKDKETVKKAIELLESTLK